MSLFAEKHARNNFSIQLWSMSSIGRKSSACPGTCDHIHQKLQDETVASITFLSSLVNLKISHELTSHFLKVVLFGDI